MSPEVKILKPKGILDNNQSILLRQQVKESINQGNKIILIDFEEVTFMDSSGLGNLVIIRRMLVDTKGKLFLTSLSDQVKMLLFELTNTGQFFQIVEDEEELEAQL